MKKNIVIAAGAAIAGLCLSGAVASAAPNYDAIANSTCTYPQVMAALNSEAPQTAQELNSSPMATSWVQNLVASPPDQRRVMLDQVSGFPGMAEYTGVFNSVAQSCQNY